jgi:hypothetical protein
MQQSNLSAIPKKQGQSLFAPERPLTFTERGWHLSLPTWIKGIAVATVLMLAITGIVFLTAGTQWTSILLGIAALAGISAAVVLWYARWIEPFWVEWRSLDLSLEGWVDDGYRIAHLTDIHLANGTPVSPERLGKIVARINAWKPDLIVITGDFVSHFDETSRAGLPRLRDLCAPDGVYGVTGNHDYWSQLDDLVHLIEQQGVRVLFNESVPIRGFTLAGVDNVWDGEPDLAHALQGVSSESPVILLAHEPNYAEVAKSDSRVRVQLSGHSHGGQVRIPFLGPLALPDGSYLYPMGLYRLGAMWLFTSRGVGVAEIPFRLFCRPEVTLITLHKAD